MTPENTVFVPLDQLNRKPEQDELPISKEHDLSGEELIAKADELIERDHRLNPEQREVARQKFRELIAAHTMNAPVLLLNMTHASTSDISDSGYATPDMWMYAQDRGDWVLVMRQAHYDYNNEWVNSEMRYNMWTFIGDVRNGSNRLLVGEEAVQDWLQSRSLACALLDDPAEFHLESDLNVLTMMRRANMPISYLDLTDEQRNKMGERMAAAMLAGDHRAGRAQPELEYLMGIETDEQRGRFYTHIAEELTELLPTTHTDPRHDSLMTAIDALAERSPYIEGQPKGVKLRQSTRHILLLAHLYRVRSRMDYQTPERTPQPLPMPELRTATENPQDFPPDRPLTMFKKNELSIEELWEDIDFINHYGAGNPEADYHKLTEARAHTISANIHKLIMSEGVQLGDLPSVFSALEIIFEAYDDASRHNLYNDVLYALARELPVRKYGRGNLFRVVGVLEVALPRMPESLRTYRGDNLRGPAEVAAVIADMYEYRASYYIQADITHTGEDADE